jgi:hypothetical protein
MATAALVDGLIADGRKLLTDLHRRRFGVSAAGWLHHATDDIWQLVVVTPSLHPGGVGERMNVVYECLAEAGDPDMELFNAVRLESPDSRLGQWLAATGERLSARPGWTVTHYFGSDLERFGFDQARIYRTIAGMSSRQVARVVGDMLGSGVLDQPAAVDGTDGVYPLAAIERGGRVLRLKPTGIRRDQTTGQLIVDAFDPASGAVQHIPADEITDVSL